MTTTSEASGPQVHEVMARAVLRNGPQVLLARLADHEFWYMPGATVRLGERAASALRRELRDELDLDPVVGDLIGVSENEYTLDGVTHHEINLVFDVRIEGHVSRSHHDGIELAWFSPDVVEGMDVRPPALATILRYGPGRARLPLLSDGLPR